MNRQWLCGVALILASAGPVAAASLSPSAYVRATCVGMQDFSESRRQASCAESNVLTDTDGTLIPGFSSAEADRARRQLRAVAAGASIRDAGYNGHEASALFKETVTVSGQWVGNVPVTVSLWLEYRFDGGGDSRMHANLHTTTARYGEGNRAHIRMRRKGYGHAVLVNAESNGNFTVPDEGVYPSKSLLILRVTQMVDRMTPTMAIRAHLQSYALPNLRSLGSAVSALISAQGRVVISAPDGLTVTSTPDQTQDFSVSSRPRVALLHDR